MRVTRVVFAVSHGPPKPGFVAYVTIELAGVFVVKGLRLVRRRDDPASYLLAMPEVTLCDGRREPVAHPIQREWREELERTVVTAWKRSQGAGAQV